MHFGQGHQRACLGASALPHRRARCRRPDSQIFSDLRRQVSRGGRKRPEAAVGGTRTSSWMLTTNAGKSAPGLLSAAAAKLCCTYMGSSSATYTVMQPGQNPLVPPPLPAQHPPVRPLAARLGSLLARVARHGRARARHPTGAATSAAGRSMASLAPPRCSPPRGHTYKPRTRPTIAHGRGLADSRPLRRAHMRPPQGHGVGPESVKWRTARRRMRPAVRLVAAETHGRCAGARCAARARKTLLAWCSEAEPKTSLPAYSK